MSGLHFEGRLGVLVAPSPTMAWLLAGAVDGWPDDAVGSRRRLREAGVLDDAGRAHPALARTLAVVRDPRSTVLRLAVGGRTVYGRLGHRASSLVTPSDDEDARTLLPVHTTLVPKAIARLVGLRAGDRPVATWSLDLEGTGGAAHLDVGSDPSGHRLDGGPPVGSAEVFARVGALVARHRPPPDPCPIR